MNKLGKFAMVGLMAVVIGGTTITAFAANSNLDNNINDNIKIKEFIEKRFESKKSIVNGRVESGQLSKEEADLIIERMEENMKYCNSKMQEKNHHNQTINDGNLGLRWRHNNYENNMNSNRENISSKKNNMVNRMRDDSVLKMKHHRNHH